MKKMTNEQLVVRIQAGEETAANMLQLWKQAKAFVAMAVCYIVSRAIVLQGGWPLFYIEWGWC